MFVYISLYTCPFARLFVHLSHVGILSTVDTTQHIRNFYRTTHMHSADYAVATCLSDHSSLCLSDSPSVCHTTDLSPCTGRKNTDIHGINCPYIMFTAMCPCVCLPHSSILYIPFVHFYDCLSIYVSLCMSIFMQIYITCTVVCPSVCYIRAPSSQYMSVCLAVHSSKFRLCL